MTIKHSAFTKITATLATNAILMISTASVAHAAPEAVMVLDDVGGLMTSCALDIGSGSTYSETSTTFSCTTSGGQTTTCDKADDNPTLCETMVVEKSGRGTGGKPALIIDRTVAPFTAGKSQTTGSTPRPGKFIMQYSLQN